MVESVSPSSGVVAMGSGFGGALETFFRQPASAVSSACAHLNCGPGHAMRHIYKMGGVAQFYGGVQWFALGAGQRVVHRAATFVLNEDLRGKGYSVQSISFLAATLETCLAMVGENSINSVQNSKEKEGIRSFFVKRIRTLGPEGLMKGFTATLGRNTTFNCFFFGLPNLFPEQFDQNPVLASFLAGNSAVIVSHPFENLRVMKALYPKETYLQGANRLGPNIFIGLPARMGSAGMGAGVALLTFRFITSKCAQSTKVP